MPLAIRSSLSNMICRVFKIILKSRENRPASGLAETTIVERVIITETFDMPGLKKRAPVVPIIGGQAITFPIAQIHLRVFHLDQRPHGNTRSVVSLIYAGRQFEPVLIMQACELIFFRGCAKTVFIAVINLYAH